MNVLGAMTYTSLVVIFTLVVMPCMFRSIVEAQGASLKLEKDALVSNTFPENFLFGVAVSAPQEAWNISGKIQYR